MKKTELKSFDIASFDIELEYNSKIAPINSKIQKLNKNHETKSLKAHKDFLEKEKKSKEKLDLLVDKALLKDQRIEKAADNKLKKLESKESKFEKLYDEYKVVIEAEFVEKHAEIQGVIKELEASQIEDIQAIKDKYNENVTSYIEKLDTYNNNYKNNKVLHKQQVLEYDELLISKLKEISEMKRSLEENTEKKLEAYIESKKSEDAETIESLAEVKRELNNQTTHIRMASNVKTKEIKAFIADLSKDYKDRAKELINSIVDQIDILEKGFVSRKELIQKDLDFHLYQMKEDLTGGEIKQTLKIKKALKMKTDFFNLRASTTIGYEERILNEKLSILKQEIQFTEETLKYELNSLNKLEVFLLSDQNELKDIGHYLKNTNIALKEELNNVELSNNDYLVKHEKLKAEFVNRYTSLFDGFKHILLSSNKSSIDQLTGINQEIDEINKYLDTADPLKEIKVNRLREIIEINEIKERYNIRFAQQQHAIKLLDNQLKNLLELEKINIKDKIFENNKEINIIKNKENLDKDLNRVKLKFEKAEEIHKLRLNSTKLEATLLDAKYEKELEIFEYEKEIAEIEVQKNSILITKELEMEIKNINLEANYRIEVINKRLEEDLLKLEDEVNKYAYEKDTFSVVLDLELSKETSKAEKEIKKINSEMNKKIALIKKALDREIKAPIQNLASSQAVVLDRLAKFDTCNADYEEFILESTDALNDDDLEIKQIKKITANSDKLMENADKYIQNTFESLEEALVFMSELELRKIKQKISSTKDKGIIKKLNKILQKINAEIKKQKLSVKNSKQDYVIVIKNKIKADLTKFNKSKIEDLDTLKERAKAIYNNSFEALKTIQSRVLEQVKDLYDPLTRNDNDLIENGKRNAEKAIALVEKEKFDKIDPINKALELFTKDIEDRKKIKLDELDSEIENLTKTISVLKDNASNEINIIKEDINELLTVKTEHLRMIDEIESAEVVKQMESIDARKRDLEDLYNQTIAKLAEKDAEAEKIFDYEERIKNIGIETANSHYKDAMVKTENKYLLNIENNNKARNNIDKEADNYLQLINKELLDLTSKFEKNIFTTRPKLEESIGDAHKEINLESKEKEKRLKELNALHKKITSSLEERLFTHFNEGYEKIEQNLNYYLEQYKLLTDEYDSSVSVSSDVISNNNIVFANVLIEQGKKKHNDTKEKLLEINIDEK